MANEQAAEVLNQDGPKPQDNAEELANAAAVKAGDVDPQATTDLVDDETHGKRLGGWQRKIKRLEMEKETLIEALRKGGGNAQSQQSQQTQEAKAPVKPNIKDFTGADAWEKYEAAKDDYFENLADFKAKDAVKQYRNESQQRAKQDEVSNGWANRVAEAENKYPDFPEVAFNPELPIPPDVAQAVIRSENGTEIIYYLGKHLSEAHRIAKMDPYDAIREIGKIESRIAGTKPADEEKPDEAAEAATTRAPKPPSPVRKTTSVNQDPEDKDDYKTWLRKREAQLSRK